MMVKRTTDRYGKKISKRLSGSEKRKQRNRKSCMQDGGIEKDNNQSDQNERLQNIVKRTERRTGETKFNKCVI